MSLPNLFSYHFYPVGQGLFSTGSIHRTGENVSRFLWVYDCGTSSSPSLVNDGIQHLKRWAETRNRIDLLILSHFDHDHISGVCSLLREFKIGTLMLPYMPLAQRLVVAFEERSGGADDPMTGFYLNPVAYLLAQEGLGIERILFVLPSGGEGPAFPEGPTEPPDWGDGDPDMDFARDKPDEREEVGPLFDAAQSAARRTMVEFLLRGSALTVRSLWEFVPYNDDPEKRIGRKFALAVRSERTQLLGAGTPTKRDAALKQLKKIYDQQFGKGSEERNMISLFLYSGPVYASWNGVHLFPPDSLSVQIDKRGHPTWGGMSWWYRFRCSILYSGDGYLDERRKLRRLVAYLKSARAKQIGVFQVMHHGAESNWHKGVAAAIGSNYSVFSSDPARKRWAHPHAQVLRDFWPHGPVQVDKENGFCLLGFLEAHR